MWWPVTGAGTSSNGALMCLPLPRQPIVKCDQRAATVASWFPGNPGPARQSQASWSCAIWPK
jgi:hypothetical protein